MLALSAAGPGPSRSIRPFTQSLRVGKNSSSYRVHSYHTKVPPEAIKRLVRHHTRDGQVVVDPFCGSGMTGIASITSGRHSVLSDLSPAAVHIARNYTAACDPDKFLAAVARVADAVRPTMDSLYEYGLGGARSRVEYTVWSDIFQCGRCQAHLVYWDAARDPKSGAVTEGVRCPKCRHVSQKRELRWVGEKPVETSLRARDGRKALPTNSAELDLIAQANARPNTHWIPQIPFSAQREMWRAGHSAAGIESVAGFYTKRNLHALAALRAAIQEEGDSRIRDALMFAFTGIVNRASKRYQWNDKRPTNVMTGTLYVASLRYEWNVWSLFERKVRAVAHHYTGLGQPSGRAAVVLASATSLVHLPDRSADYVYMDPPFGSNIFYADSSLLWEAWLGALTDEAKEIVVNRHRSPTEGGKTISDYQRLMSRSFREVARILKPTAYATLQFNNSNDEVWCAIQDALADAGLSVRYAVGLDKIHPSIKGVKGRQAKEDVPSVDTLIELRKTQRRVNGHSRVSTTREVSKVLLQFARTERKAFTTDAAFAHVVRTALKSRLSLAGISMRAVKETCHALFQQTGTRWISKARA